MLHKILLFAHVLSAFLYLLAHGASAAVAYHVRRETSIERVRALLDLSRATVPVANFMFLTTVACGIALGALGHWWSARWFWLSIVILMIVLAVMARTAGPYFRRIRAVLGLEIRDGATADQVRGPSARELAKALESGSALTITVLAVSGWAVILWLMLFKPF